VSTAPRLPAGFTKTFRSRFVQANGIRQHVVIGGDGPPLLLVHGWPENWYAWRFLMPALARDFTVIAVDQRGIGLTEKTRDGYDAGTLGDDLAALMTELGHQRFALVGHDTGYIISYALAADHRDRVARLVVAEIPGPPGVVDPLVPPPPLFLPEFLNNKLWHIPFNRVNDELIVDMVKTNGRRLLPLRVLHPGRRPDAARLRHRLLRRPVHPRPEHPARQLRPLPCLGRHPRAERETPGDKADHPRPRNRRREQLGSRRRRRNQARRDRRADPSDPRRRPLGRRTSPRGNAQGARHLPGPVPDRRIAAASDGRCLARPRCQWNGERNGPTIPLPGAGSVRDGVPWRIGQVCEGVPASAKC
jgi:pimeloyl-ACP methyl ester carboxylesterase